MAGRFRATPRGPSRPLSQRRSCGWRGSVLRRTRVGPFGLLGILVKLRTAVQGLGWPGTLAVQSLASCRAALSEIELSGECFRAALGESQPSTRRHSLAVPPPRSWRLTLDLIDVRAAPQENSCRGHLPSVQYPSPVPTCFSLPFVVGNAKSDLRTASSPPLAPGFPQGHLQ